MVGIPEFSLLAVWVLASPVLNQTKVCSTQSHTGCGGWMIKVLLILGPGDLYLYCTGLVCTYL
jgi:hypothetical protein